MFIEHHSVFNSCKPIHQLLYYNIADLQAHTVSKHDVHCAMFWLKCFNHMNLVWGSLAQNIFIWEESLWTNAYSFENHWLKQMLGNARFGGIIVLCSVILLTVAIYSDL